MANPRPSVTAIAPYQWKAGQSGNPGGKAAGARNRLQGNFLNDLADHYAEKGKNAIERMWAKNPTAYVRAIVSLMPKEISASGLLDDLGNDDLRALVEIVKAARARRAALGQPEAPSA